MEPKVPFLECFVCRATSSTPRHGWCTTQPTKPRIRSNPTGVVLSKFTNLALGRHASPWPLNGAEAPGQRSMTC